MNCPRCSIELEKRSVDGIELDECRQCGGIWFDRDELRKLKDHEDSDLNWMDFDIWKHRDLFHVSEKPAKCPKCQFAMASIGYGNTGVKVDFCVDCEGIWLDGGEFEKIISALEKELENKTALQYLRASLQEAREIFTGTEGFISEWRDFKTILRIMEYRVLAENPKLAEVIEKIQEANPLK